MLQKNTSTLLGQRFCSTFNGEEFFLKDHQVQGQKVLPGVIYLEMVVAAIHYATENIAEGSIQLSNMIWPHAFIVDQEPRAIHLRLDPEESGDLRYEIYTESPDHEVHLHHQGIARLGVPMKSDRVDIVSIQQHTKDTELSQEACYAAFSQMGLQYGRAHQGIEKLYIGKDEVLASLMLPASLTETAHDFTLHPSLLDAALQASMGLLMKPGMALPETPALPFALETLRFIKHSQHARFAWVRYAEGTVASSPIQKLDIDLCDESGHVCIQMQGLSTRVLERQDIPQDRILFKPIWKAEAAHQEADRSFDRHIILCGIETLVKPLTKALPNASILSIARKDFSLPHHFETVALQLLTEVQRCIQEKLKESAIQVLVPSEGELYVFEGLTGLLKTAQLEYPHILGQVITIPANTEGKAALRLLKENQATQEVALRYEEGKRWVLHWEEIARTRSNGRDSLERRRNLSYYWRCRSLRIHFCRRNSLQSTPCYVNSNRTFATLC